MDVTISKNGVPTRLTEERWLHIVENHDDVAGYYDEVLNTIEEPDYVIKGYRGAFIALRKVTERKFLAVVYRETSEEDAFIITAYFTSKLKLEEETITWEKQL
ncbi:MAG: hypothetical protein J7J98_00775 [candidate division Zixibacteria bacterium]|nr:hypothetical protein [candidate division Zixibacteria bacterium]